MTIVVSWIIILVFYNNIAYDRIRGTRFNVGRGPEDIAYKFFKMSPTMVGRQIIFFAIMYSEMPKTASFLL